MKKLHLDLDDLAVESFRTDSDRSDGGTVQGHVWTWFWTGCDTCANTCDAGAATCGASCGVACRQTVNTPDCYTVSCPAQTYCGAAACVQWQIDQAAAAAAGSPDA